MDEELKKIGEKYKNTLSELLLSFNQKEIEDEKIISYKLEIATLSRLKNSRQWFLSGISGSGKSTVTSKLEAHGFARLPNVTTRPQRLEEKENDYIFTDQKTFAEWERADLLFHPHLTNGVSHAIFNKDLKRLNTTEKLYADKSVRSLTVMHKELSTRNANFIYILAPTFQDLYKRISDRERNRSTETALSHRNILDRFEEEIKDLKQSIKLPYIYLVNDTPERILNVITPHLE